MASSWNSAAISVTFAVILISALSYSFGPWLIKELFFKKKVPGIPYNKSAENRFWGDLPDLRQKMSNGEMLMSEWFGSHSDQPLFQLFISPMIFLIVKDGPTIENILTKRTKEFIRADLTIASFTTVLPHGTIALPSNSEWKETRKAWAPTMGTDFQTGPVARVIVEHTRRCVALWKSRTGEFDAIKDLSHNNMDIISKVTMGIELGSLAAAARGEPEQPLFSAIEHMFHSIEEITTSPLPAFSHFFLRLRPKWRRDYKFILNTIKQTYYNEELDGENCAIALVKSRSPNLPYTSMRDEAITFMFGGYDTTNATLQFGLRLLTANPSCQIRLKTELDNSLPPDFAAADVLSANLPYTEATVQEINRMALVATLVMRMTAQDTTLLGHQIPKGVNVLMMSGNVGMTEWPDEYPADRFMPERWLASDGSFEPSKHQLLAFSAGVRGCFGKRMAMMQIKLILATLLSELYFDSVSAGRNGPAVTEALTRHPKECFIRPVEWSLGASKP